jgi:Uma2 family endonuclease
MLLIDTQSEKKSYTYKDYSDLPEGAPYQLIGGDLIISPAPNKYHQTILKRLTYFLYDYAEVRNEIGEVFVSPVDVFFDEKNSFQPDIIFLLKQNINIFKEDKVIGAPDIIIEILSPSNAYYDLKYKKNIYEKYGVKEYWIVDPIEMNIEIFENLDGRFVLINRIEKTGILKSKIIKDLEIDLNKVF